MFKCHLGYTRVGQRKVHSDGVLAIRRKNLFLKTFYLYIFFCLLASSFTPLASVFWRYCLFIRNFVTMGHLTADDRSLLWILRTQKGWGLMAYDEGKEFPNKTMLFGVPLNRWCIAVDDSLQSSSTQLVQPSNHRVGQTVTTFHWSRHCQWRRKQFASWGAHAGQKFLMCPLTFLLCPPPHEGAQRLFVTDWETIEVVKSGEGQ